MRLFYIRDITAVRAVVHILLLRFCLVTGYVIMIRVRAYSDTLFWDNKLKSKYKLFTIFICILNVLITDVVIITFRQMRSAVFFRCLLIRLTFIVFRSEPCILTACYGKILEGIRPIIKNNRVCIFF